MNATPSRWIALALLPALLLSAGCSDDDDSPGGGTVLPDRYKITFYYTPVESFFGGPPQAVTGCTSIDCVSGLQDLGAYPADFIAAVRLEGSGRLTSGPYAGQYLNGSYGGNFWISSFPPDAYRSSLRPFETAAANESGLPRGTRFRLVGPLLENGSPIPSAVESRLLDATWNVQDRFEPGYGGTMHLDLYVGDQTTPSFASSPFYLLLENTAIEVF
ncbi:MAG: hypothetical protein PHR34_05185 [Kiritimatiellae bacterium]|jgi:hypothetical protein|nr:hypothetical protein [Kiritimatiellia bacterium]MDD3440602.1 hypothetical protein [Kiritimatiellia bacterium]MDD4118479.1 hypothetical protein [Kiritimatiellia bacterium]